MDRLHWYERLLLPNIYGFDMHFPRLRVPTTTSTFCINHNIRRSFVRKDTGWSFHSEWKQIHFGYYLTDKIYPAYLTFVKAFWNLVDPRDILFKRRQEWTPKDVERAFGVLKSKWHIIEHAARQLDLETLQYIMYVNLKPFHISPKLSNCLKALKISNQQLQRKCNAVCFYFLNPKTNIKVQISSMMAKNYEFKSKNPH